MIKKKNLIILGSTGSIGENTIKVVEHLSNEIEVTGLSAGSNVTRLLEQIHHLKCPRAAIADESLYPKLKAEAPDYCKIFSGLNGINEMIADAAEADMVLCAILGAASLSPVLTAIETGKDIAIASKEALVMAGHIVMKAAADNNVKILPVDSEHSAVFQCIEGQDKKNLKRIILTASGGAFRDKNLDFMKKATLSDALSHPTWDMGAKITIDSATLMNKALEIIEARWLFDLQAENIDVVIHHQSIIHSMVEFVDGTMLAQLGTPDMRFPIQYALTYPKKFPASTDSLDFTKISNLTFKIPDSELFPSLNFAYEALKIGGTMPTVLNAANEIAVQSFINGKIPFTYIWKIIEKTMTSHKILDRPNLDAIFNADKEARKYASALTNNNNITGF